jgi:hypothetical protein
MTVELIEVMTDDANPEIDDDCGFPKPPSPPSPLRSSSANRRRKPTPRNHRGIGGCHRRLLCCSETN